MYTCSLYPDAIAIIKGGAEFPNITGEVLFYQADAAVLVVVNISGLPQTSSGFSPFTFTRGIPVLGKPFLPRKVTTTPQRHPIPATPATFLPFSFAQARRTCPF